MLKADLQAALAHLPRIGTRVKNRSYRQVWRFEFAGRAYYLKFYPLRTLWLKRLVRGSSAAAEFQKLQWLQEAGIPAPRAVAAYSAVRIDGHLGDAIVMDALEPSIQLDAYLNDLSLRDQSVPDHRRLAGQIQSLLHQLGQAGLGHNDLHLGNFLLHDGRIHLLDGYAVHRRGLRLTDLQKLANSATGFATRTDLLRAWKQLGPGGPLPRRNPMSLENWRNRTERIWGSNRYFGQLRDGPWRGTFFKRFKHPQYWSPASRLRFEQADWQQAWQGLVAQFQSGELEILRRDPSGDTFAAELQLGNHSLPVLIQRPAPSPGLLSLLRPNHARRIWWTAWQLIFRSIPTAWPLLRMEKKSLGLTTESLLVFERVPGQPLSTANLAALDAPARQTLLHRVGALLRRLEQTGLYPTTLSADTVRIITPPGHGPLPILADVSSIRTSGHPGHALQAFLPQLTPVDAQSLRRGYAPFASVP